MAHRIPCHSRTNRHIDLVVHRQKMATYARVMNSNGDLAGFRPQYMEHVLVAAGQADASLTNQPLSKRQKAKRKSKLAFLEKMRGLVDGRKPVGQSL